MLTELGYVGARVREDVTARMPNVDEQQVLGVESGEPVLCLTRLTMDRQDTPIQVARACI